MIKELIAIIVLSALTVLGMPYIQQVLAWLVEGHAWISQSLMQVFSGGEVGSVLREMIALLVIPVLAGLVPSLIYWAVKRSWLPCFMYIVWIVWLIQASAVIIQYKP